MRTLLKIIIIIGISVIALPIYGIAHEQHLALISIPVAVGYIAAITAVWRWQPKKEDDKFSIKKD
jgi:hypothetical protein